MCKTLNIFCSTCIYHTDSKGLNCDLKFQIESEKPKLYFSYHSRFEDPNQKLLLEKSITTTNS